MESKIQVSQIYDQNLSFLIGSGASHGLLPTLALAIKDELDEQLTVETLAAQFDKDKDPRATPLFMHYYSRCVRPAEILNWDKASEDQAGAVVLKNYQDFLKTILQILIRRKPMDRRCNIFTTNYDGCFALAAQQEYRRGTSDFIVNDGGRGFQESILHTRNYNSIVCNTGIFEQHLTAIPQINLVHLHGSVYWRKSAANIVVSYDSSQRPDLLSENLRSSIESFTSVLEDETRNINDLPIVNFEGDAASSFIAAYNSLPIVNPTRWKFHETVFEEHYYQMLRMLSYELEKPNAVLITFGFSFADQHILSLIKRSLSNPFLQVFVCCFNTEEASRLKQTFGAFRNVQCIEANDGNLDFSLFNESVFTVSGAPVIAGAETS